MRLLLIVTVSSVISACTTVNSDARLGDGSTATANAEQKLTDAESKLYLGVLQEQGGRALAANNFEEAKTAYRQILHRDPNNARALLGMGEVDLASRDYRRALLYFSKNLGDTDKAIQGAALQGQGISFVKLARNKDGEASLRKAVALDPTLWRSWNALGRSLDKRQMFKEARASYDKAIALKPDAAILLNNRGVSYMLEGLYPEAERDFLEAIFKDPALKKAKGNLRLVLAWQGKYQEALSGIDHIEGPIVLNNVGYIAFKRGDYERAESFFVEAMRLSPAFYAKADRNLRLLQQVRKSENLAKRTKR